MRLDPEKLELLVLARLAVKTKKPPAVSDLIRAIKPFVEHVLSSAESTEAIDRALASLEARADITAKPYALTDRGEKKVLRFLGLEKLPRVDWRAMRDKHLTRTVLGVDRIKDADALRGAILKRQHQLPTKETPTLAQAIDALVWRQLGIETDKPLTLNEVRAHLLRKMLGTESRLGIEKIKNVLAAEAAGSTSPDAARLRLALVRGWLGANGRSFDLDRFAEQVNLAAARAEEGRFGDDRVFIAAVWRELDSELSLDEFKRHLIEANRTGLVRLTRADLIPAMDPEQVSASETHYLNATFHFVEARGAS